MSDELKRAVERLLEVSAYIGESQWTGEGNPWDDVRAALAKREAVAVPDGYVMVEIGYLPDRCIAAARRDAAIVAKVAPNDDCAILSAAISAYLLAASQQAAKEAKSS